MAQTTPTNITYYCERCRKSVQVDCRQIRLDGLQQRNDYALLVHHTRDLPIGTYPRGITHFCTSIMHIDSANGRSSFEVYGEIVAWHRLSIA